MHSKKDPILTTFSQLGLASQLLKALDEEGYATPTPIQTKAIPPVLEGADLLGIAQTGTGKTAAFALPILHRLDADRRAAPRKGCRVLVLAPTRELATQIAESFRAYGRHMGFSVAVVFGGVAHRPQREALARGVDVLVATPGRLIDHIEERNADISGTEILVLDEADQMLDLGFFRRFRRIVSLLSTRRQSLFFSATMPAEIGKLASEMLRDPVKVSVAPAATTVERVTQKVIHVEHARKRALLVELLADPDLSRALVFTRTKRGADRVARHLEDAGIGVAAIHGNKSQRQREEALERFRDSRIRVLVATDIAARGIDIDAVSHVVNYELPDVPESYVHRIGRTARAGASGNAISLVDIEERTQLRDIERVTRQSIPAEDRRNDSSLAVDARRSEAPRRTGEGRGERRASSNDQRPRGEGERTSAGRHRNGGGERGGAGARNGAGHRGGSGERSTRGDRNGAGDRNGRSAHTRHADRDAPAAGRSGHGAQERGEHRHGSADGRGPRRGKHGSSEQQRAEQPRGQGKARTHRHPQVDMPKGSREDGSALSQVGFMGRAPRRGEERANGSGGTRHGRNHTRRAERF